jgi:hypothetical protein
MSAGISGGSRAGCVTASCADCGIELFCVLSSGVIAATASAAASGTTVMFDDCGIAVCVATISEIPDGSLDRGA